MTAIELPVRKPGQPGREKIVPVLLQIAAALDRLDARLAALEERPARVEVREWKPNHRRLVDGGTTVRRQRRNVAKMTPPAPTIRRVP